MAKFYGSIGFADETEEKSPGVWKADIVDHDYSGDVIRDTRRMDPGENVNDNLTLSNQISIIADPFATTNLTSMRYVKWLGVKWKITSVEVQHPRLLLSLGGVYNE
jgi:hypothetical protein